MEKQKSAEKLLKPHVVLYPAHMSMGHLLPFMDLATRLLTQHAFVVTIITAKPRNPSIAKAYASYLQAFTSHQIRLLELPPPPQEEQQAAHPLLNFLSSVEKSNNALQDLVLESCGQDPSLIRAFIVDFFHMAAVDAIAQLSIPTYLFTTSSANNLCLKFHLPKFMEENPDFRDRPEALIHVPGMRPMAIRDLPPLFVDKSCPAAASAFVGLCSRLRQLTGIFVNSFVEMEETAIRAAQQQFSRVYPIGPLLCSSSVESKAVVEESGTECLRWLDGQPASSVVYVSFGSYAAMTEGQIAEIALGLERSGWRFLWVVRGEEKDSDAGKGLRLPEGFESRVGGRGLLVSSWAPQVQILAHPAVGGFVSHCGWSSTLEGIWNGVGFACWPLGAEQRMNCLLIVNELEIGLEVKKDEDGIVKREEVERAVEELMGGEHGSRLKINAKQFSKRARDAMEENTGSSFKSLKAAVFDFIAGSPKPERIAVVTREVSGDSDEARK